MTRRQQNTHRLSHLIAIISLWLRGVRVQFVLAGWVLPDYFGRKLRRLRAGFPVRRAVVTAVVCAAIVIPTVLYVQERSDRMEISRAHRYLNTSSYAEIGTLRGSLQALLAEQEDLRTMLLDAGYTVAADGEISARLVATGYSSTVWETDDTPFITASNTRTRPGVIAMSRDLLQRYNPQAPFKFGDVVHISGYGDFMVEDSMHWRWRRRVDIWFPSRQKAWQFGKQSITLTMPLNADAGVVATGGATEGGSTGATEVVSSSRTELPQ